MNFLRISKDNLLHRDQHLYQHPLSHLLTLPTSSMKAWIAEHQIAVTKRNDSFHVSDRQQYASLRAFLLPAASASHQPSSTASPLHSDANQPNSLSSTRDIHHHFPPLSHSTTTRRPRKKQRKNKAATFPAQNMVAPLPASSSNDLILPQVKTKRRR